MRVSSHPTLRTIIVIIAAGLNVLFGIGSAAAQTGPTISARDTVANEGDGTAKFSVRLSAPTSQTVSLQYETVTGSADNFDYGYTGSAGHPLSFAPGETAKVVSISLKDDAIPEGTESFYLRLREPRNIPMNGSIGTGAATANIFDNDGPAGTPMISVSDPVADESAGSAIFVVSLSQRSTSKVKVNYATQAGSAGTDDFTAKSGTVTFAPGQRVKTVSLPILNDASFENTETANLLLSNPVNATLPDNRGTARIWSNDQPPLVFPTITADDTAANEGDGIVSFLVRLSAPTSQTVSLQYETVTGSADNFDYGYTGSAGHPLSFAPGETAKVVSISLKDDAIPEGTESFYLRLREPRNIPINGSIGTGAATANIFDNDGPAGIPMISVSDPVADESAGSAIFVVSLSQRSTSKVSVNYTTQTGSSGIGDFTAASGIAAFASGERVKTVSVPILNDAAVENVETFNLLLSNPISARLFPTIAAQRVSGATISPRSYSRRSLPTTLPPTKVMVLSAFWSG